MSDLFNLFPYGSNFIYIILVFILPVLSFITGCNSSNNGLSPKTEERKKIDSFKTARLKMIENQIKARGIKDPLVLNAMTHVKRHLFVPKHLWDMAYNDYPLPIGHGQTISQPYIVALMTELLELKGGEKVLEVGTGSGYQAAILGEIAGEVFTIEIIEDLAHTARQKLEQLGYKNIHVRTGDGYLGWPEEAPFDTIIITAAPDHIPNPLIEQIKMHGIIVLPMGSYFQDLYKIRKTEKGLSKEKIAPVRFVPMTGEAEK